MRVYVEAKSLFKSRLFWIGFLQVIIGVAELIRTNVLESERAAWGSVIFGALTIVLRILTTQPIKLPGDDDVKTVEGRMVP